MRFNTSVAQPRTDCTARCEPSAWKCPQRDRFAGSVESNIGTMAAIRPNSRVAPAPMIRLVAAVPNEVSSQPRTSPLGPNPVGIWSGRVGRVIPAQTSPTTMTPSPMNQGAQACRRPRERASPSRVPSGRSRSSWSPEPNGDAEAGGGSEVITPPYPAAPHTDHVRRRRGLDRRVAPSTAHVIRGGWSGVGGC